MPTNTSFEAAVGSSAKEQASVEISVVMPCLNEAETLAACITKTQKALQEHDIQGEIVVADNGSTDGSQQIGLEYGARVVNVKERGYRNALRGGIAAARGKYVLMGDADDSYDFTQLPKFLVELRNGSDLVMGSRFRGGIADGAMPFLHRYLGNPVLTWLGRLFFKAPCGDFHCGLRGFTKDGYERMALHTTGMEFASEMVVKASLMKFSNAAPDSSGSRIHDVWFPIDNGSFFLSLLMLKHLLRIC